MYYNFAAGIFLSKKLSSTLHSIEVDFPKTGKLGISTPHLGELGTSHGLR